MPLSIHISHYDFIKKEARFIVFVFVILLAGAVITDFVFDKIFNEWLLFFLTVTWILRIWQEGADGLFLAIGSMLIPVILLYPLFKIGTLGAGDIKLLAVAGCFMSATETVYLICYSFLIGALLSLLLLIREKSFASRMRHLFFYFLNTFKNKTWERYEELEPVNKGRTYVRNKKGRIHFSLPILLSAMLWIGGAY